MARIDYRCPTCGQFLGEGYFDLFLSEPPERDDNDCPFCKYKDVDIKDCFVRIYNPLETLESIREARYPDCRDLGLADIDRLKRSLRSSLTRDQKIMFCVEPSSSFLKEWLDKGCNIYALSYFSPCLAGHYGFKLLPSTEDKVYEDVKKFYEQEDCLRRSDRYYYPISMARIWDKKDDWIMNF